MLRNRSGNGAAPTDITFSGKASADRERERAVPSVAEEPEVIVTPFVHSQQRPEMSGAVPGKKSDHRHGCGNFWTGGSLVDVCCGGMDVGTSMMLWKTQRRRCLLKETDARGYSGALGKTSDTWELGAGTVQ